MTTQEKIQKIIAERYGNYNGRFNKPFEKIHEAIRKREGDEKFLLFLEQSERDCPKPIYKNQSK